MGSFQGKEKSNNLREKDVEALRAKVKLQKEEMKEIMSMRENESQAYEQEIIVFALKEAEWKRERKRLRQEVRMFKRRLEEERNRRLMEDDEGEGEGEGEGVGVGGEKSEKDLGNSYLMECMRERERRDEAVEKWKKLYLAIKTELDHLIKMTHQGQRASWISEEEELLDELHRELKAKEETIKLLLAQLASMEKEKWRMEREVDILRQSLRIMSHHKKKGKHNGKSFRKTLAKQI